MLSRKRFYFSRVLGTKVLTEGDSFVGRVADFAVDVINGHVEVVGIVARKGRKSFFVDFAGAHVRRVSHRYHVVVDELVTTDTPPDALLYLRSFILDQQIVDVDGKKLVRVNDLLLENGQVGVSIAAVDVGIEGLLRRLGVAKLASRVCKVFGVKIPSKLILWKDVETVTAGSHQIKLSQASNKLATFHPSDLADILEDMDRGTQVAVFSSLDEEKAADVLEALEPEAQVELIENLPIEKAADVLEKMPADEAADILDDMGDEKVEELLQEMEGVSSQEVRNLLEYPENAVGSFMSTDFIDFNESLTVGDALQKLRALRPEADTMYCLYVTDAEERYVAAVSIRDIVVSDPKVHLRDIMNDQVEPIPDMEDVYSMAELLLKYKLHSVPVVDEAKKMVGTIIIEDVLDYVLRQRRRR